MAQQYQQLTIEEREKIQMDLWEGKSIRSIAFELNRSPSTISREVNKNVPRQYRRYTSRLAHARAIQTRKTRGQRKRLKNQFIQEYVIKKLKDDLSPEQIAGRLKLEHPKYSISHEAIYEFIYAQYHRDGYGDCRGLDLRQYLKRRHKQRKRKHVPFKERRGTIINRIFIDKRPEVVDKRERLGDWEGDSMVSRKSTVGLNTLVDRVSGLVFITKINNGTKKETTKAVISRLSILSSKLRKTLTLDNGHENAGHEIMSRTLEVACYFAHPYHSWERGTNENTNGLIRYYLPKGTDFAKVNNKTIKKIETKLNNRPRKRLGWKTPLEVFNQGVALKC